MVDSFHSVASEVLKESILTAMLIDDKALEPFEEKKEWHEDYSNLHKSFKENNCLLDIRRYNSKEYRRWFRKSLSKIDLLVLDWQLDDYDTEFLMPLELLASAISSKNVHFVCIYTKMNKKQIEDNIIYPMTSYFSSTFKRKSSNINENFKEILDIHGIDLQDLKNKLGGLLKELTFFQHQKEETFEKIHDINDVIQEIDISDDFIKFIESSYNESDIANQLIHFGYDLLENPSSRNSFTIEISQKDLFTIYINNTVIKIRNKVEIQPEVLYDDFCGSLISEKNIFFTLFGLEMRNRFRESAGFIGAEIGRIDHIALFYHQNQVTSMEFLELLKKIWTEQASSFPYDKEVKIFGELENYKSEKGIKKEVREFKKSDMKNQNNLARLNVFYNSLISDRKPKDKIKFGDIFKIKWNNKYLLCITPHCDCAYPENIDFMFHFIEGKELILSKGLKDCEGKFRSFIYYNQYTSHEKRILLII